MAKEISTDEEYEMMKPTDELAISFGQWSADVVGAFAIGLYVGGRRDLTLDTILEEFRQIGGIALDEISVFEEAVRYQIANRKSNDNMFLTEVIERCEKAIG